MGHTADAEKYYKLAAKNVRRSTLRVVQGYGYHLERSGKTERARRLYDTYLTENPDSVVLGPAVARLGTGVKPDLLVSTPAEGIAEALFNIAGMMTQQNSAQLALIYGQLALHLRKDFDLARMLVAGILETMTRNEDAIAIYRQIDQKSPFHWSARLRLAGNLEALDRDDDAINLLRVLTKKTTSGRNHWSASAICCGPTNGSLNQLLLTTARSNYCPCSRSDIGRSFIRAASRSNARSSGNAPNAISSTHSNSIRISPTFSTISIFLGGPGDKPIKRAR